ncbi:MAG: BatA domain-containing protein [Pirellulales bacterium]
MGLLTPLFLAALAGLAAPVLFHLVRQAPRGRRDFSSLMFLTPTPPRLTRRSRIDQWLLLLLRLAAFAALCIAFARPFLRESSLLTLRDLPRRRVALLVDCGASLQRAGLWAQVVSQVQQELDQLAPHDDVALYAAGAQLAAVVDFPAADSPRDAAPAEQVRSQLAALQPTWAASDLGAALSALAAELSATSDVRQSLAEPVIVVVSDFTRGEKLDSLQATPWPAGVRVVLRPVTPASPTNATLQLLTDEEEEGTSEPRVRVVNAANSTRDQFTVRWTSSGAAARPATSRPNASLPGEMSVQVPPGESRVVRLPVPTEDSASDRLELHGDDHPFDNVCHVAPPSRQQIVLAYLGNDAATDPQGWQYYVRLATADDPWRTVEFRPLTEDLTPLSVPPPPRLAIVTRALTTTQIEPLRNFVQRGGTLLLVPADATAAATQRPLLPGTSSDSSATPDPAAGQNTSATDSFVLLGELDFTHPLLAPLAGPRYNDFTKIHFWRYRRLKLPDDTSLRVVARFDDGHPWIVHGREGSGQVLWWNSGWNIDDSQLAVSSKFVPLFQALLDLACGTTRPLTGVLVNDPVSLPTPHPALIVRRPDGSTARLAAEVTRYDDTTLPGVYEAAGGDTPLRFAVNLAPRESDTAPLDPDRWEQLGVPIGGVLTRPQQLEQLRQERDTELEGRQQVWRWLVAMVIGLLLCETWWAGRTPATSPSVEALG